MSLANIPWPWTFLGLAVIAAGLFALQRLRIRHKEQVVPTLLFWKTAVEETRARVLVRRFRHPWVYLMLLVACSSLWLAAAGLEKDDAADGIDRCLLLDLSAAMDRPGRFEAAREAVLEAAGPGGRSRVTILGCGARPMPLLLPGENRALLARRIEKIAPEPVPSSLAEALESLLAGRRPGHPLAIEIIGDSPLPESLVKALPEGVTVTRRLGEDLADLGIAALGVADPVSGAADRVDLLVGLTEGLNPASFEVRLDGALLTPEASTSTAAESVFRDLPAAGGLVEATVVAASPGAAARARLVLPRRRLIPVRAGDDLPPALRQALLADPRLEIGGAGIGVGRGADDLFVLTAAGTTPAIRLICDGARETPEEVLDLFAGIGFDELARTETAPADESQPELRVEAGDRRRVELREDLLGPEWNLGEIGAFPVFCGRALRWLADLPPEAPIAAVGRTLPVAVSPLRDPNGRRFDAAGMGAAPLRPGEHQSDAAGSIAVSRLAAPVAQAARLSAASAFEGVSGADWTTLFGLLALLLLVVDWIYFRKGRIP